MTGKHPAVLLAVVALGLLLSPITARAGTNLGMLLFSSPVFITLCDNDVNFSGCTHNAADENPMVGSILFDGQVGGWTLNTASGVGPPALVPPPDLLDLSAASVSSSVSTSPITFGLTLTGLTAPLGNITLLTSSTGTSTLSSTTITVSTWLSSANTASCTSGLCGGTLVSTQVYSGTTWGSLGSGTEPTGVGPYSVALLVTIDTHGLADTITFAPTLTVLQPCVTCGRR